jgi:hypothetical protein
MFSFMAVPLILALRVQFPDTGAWRLGMGSLLAYSLA